MFTFGDVIMQSYYYASARKVMLQDFSKIREYQTTTKQNKVRFCARLIDFVTFLQVAPFTNMV